MKELLLFLKELEANNNREWFAQHKEKFQELDKGFKNLVFEIQEGLDQIDNIESESTRSSEFIRTFDFLKIRLLIIYTGVRVLKRATKRLRGGYYFKIKRGESALAGGFFGPSPSDMLHIRKQIQQNPDELRSILNSKIIQDYLED